MALDGKIALVSGSGQGVGQGIAFALARAGAKLVLFGRTKSKLVTTKGTIEKRGGEALVVAGDVCNASDLERAVDAAVEKWGGIDILVNNAQQVPNGPLLDVTDEAFELGFKSGPLAILRLMKLVQPIMKERGGGVIFNLVSSAGIRWDMSGFGAYGSVKQAIRPLTSAAASEWGRDHIRVLSIAPHAKSPGLERWIEKNPEEAEAFFRTIPLGKIGECEEDIGCAVVGLCGPEFSYLTGATIPLDGGQANFD
ncbi:SDR family NAD(P)-dependent oxidoreductase [Erythrobacter alti]|uniref:SDR family NAD(P)-dependent oxidoreductase n=1 Tax=Erythrobacter alti TaxID=1896145 RepID=UPI0030F40434